MEAMNKYLGRALAICAIVSLSACSGMTRTQQDTAVGAAVGGVAGAALTGGTRNSDP